MSENLQFALITLAMVAFTAFSGFIVGIASRATLEDRCGVTCRSESRGVSSWDDVTHVCTCRSGKVSIIRTTVETIREGREP